MIDEICICLYKQRSLLVEKLYIPHGKMVGTNQIFQRTVVIQAFVLLSSTLYSDVSLLEQENLFSHNDISVADNVSGFLAESIIWHGYRITFESTNMHVLLKTR